MKRVLPTLPDKYKVDVLNVGILHEPVTRSYVKKNELKSISLVIGETSIMKTVIGKDFVQRYKQTVPDYLPWVITHIEFEALKEIFDVKKQNTTRISRAAKPLLQFLKNNPSVFHADSFQKTLEAMEEGLQKIKSQFAVNTPDHIYTKLERTTKLPMISEKPSFDISNELQVWLDLCPFNAEFFNMDI